MFLSLFLTEFFSSYLVDRISFFDRERELLLRCFEGGA